MSILASAWTRRLGALVLIAASLAASLSPRTLARAQTSAAHTVTWDSHSLLVDGKRVLLFGGEFHYWRLPAPDQWTDRLEKMKAAGLNAVSIYFDWQYHSNAPGQYDFTGVRDIDRLLSIADHLGLYVVARVGPYMNGEADAGGLPGWLLTRSPFLRSQSWNGTVAQPQYSPQYVQYSKEWFDHVLPIIARHQVTRGGSVILVQVENEYSQDTGSEQYMRDLVGFARADGITVPIFHNDFYFKGDWSKVVDLYAFDSYPYGFSCCHQWWDAHFHGIDTWESTLRGAMHITTPMFASELQGGSFDPWGGKGYDAVAATLDGDWLKAVDQSALAQGTTLLNTYMFVGGTTWGYMGEPDVYTSYDYGAPISESGMLRPSYYAAHELGSFLQSYGPSLAGADAAPGASASNPSVVVHSRVDSASGQTFVFLRHGDAGNPVSTTLSLREGANTFTIPQRPKTSISVPGHGSALLLANTQVGPLHLNYSTSQVLSDCSTAQGHYLVLYGPAGSEGETDFVRPDTGVTVRHNPVVYVTETPTELRLNYVHTDDPRVINISSADGTLHLVITSSTSAARYWCSDGMVVAGPDLVTENAGHLTLWSSQVRPVTVYGAPPDRSLLIDGTATALPDPTMGLTQLGNLAGASAVGLPALAGWKFAPESPEISPAYDDSAWIPADHTGTSNPNVPPTSTLLADDYGFHYGFVWYRGHFMATGQEQGIAITARHSFSVYLNGTYLGSSDAALSDPPHVYASLQTFDFPAGTLRQGQDNVLSVLTESLGHDEGWVAGPAAQSPQGILSATLYDATTPISWRIQGAKGAEQPADSTRGLFNVSGLYGERQGWYLPSFDDSGWQSVSVPDDWQTRNVTAGIGWYRTHVRLDLPAGVQAPIGLTLPGVSDKAVVWVNGWLLGRYWQQKGPQHTFYLPDGVLKPHGDNIIAIAVWNRGGVGGLTSAPTLSSYGALTSHSLAVGDTPAPPDTGYWHTQGNRILDAEGRPVRIAAVNWFGMEDTNFVPAGLDRQPLDAILSHIKDLGFNAVRLPFSNELVEKNPVVTQHLDANPDLRGIHALDVMDRIVASAGKHGLRIILDDGRSSAGTKPQWNGLWYTAQYPETAWIRDWQLLVRRYLDNPTVVAVDLRNEPHTAPPGPWSVKTYLTQGATWGPYNGIEHAATDWRLGAERGGNAVLAINPRLLVMVEGIQQYPNPSWADGIESYWWGGILYPARQYPVELSVPHQLVYSPHEYGPLKWQMPFFGPHMSYAGLRAVWNQHWGFLEKPTFPHETPIFIGEFGTCGDTTRCVDDQTPGSEGLWFQYLMQYLKSHPEISWGYWAVNGTNNSGNVTPKYVFKSDWQSLQLPRLVNTLRNIEAPPPPAH